MRSNLRRDESLDDSLAGGPDDESATPGPGGVPGGLASSVAVENLPSAGRETAREPDEAGLGVALPHRHGHPAKRNLLDLSFHVLLLLKGLFAAGEILAGLGAAFVTPDRLNRLIDWIVRDELDEDPHDWLMTRLAEFGQSFSVSSQHFAIFYLLSHGLVKLVVIVLLWKKQLWAYPLSIVVFLGFIAYQMVRFTSTHSIMLVLLTLLDIVMIVLTILEYRKTKAERREVAAV